MGASIVVRLLPDGLIHTAITIVDVAVGLLFLAAPNSDVPRSWRRQRRPPMAVLRLLRAELQRRGAECFSTLRELEILIAKREGEPPHRRGFFVVVRPPGRTSKIASDDPEMPVQDERKAARGGRGHGSGLRDWWRDKPQCRDRSRAEKLFLIGRGLWKYENATARDQCRVMFVVRHASAQNEITV
jgi:hypothetical protein